MRLQRNEDGSFKSEHRDNTLPSRYLIERKQGENDLAAIWYVDGEKPGVQVTGYMHWKHIELMYELLWGTLDPEASITSKSLTAAFRDVASAIGRIYDANREAKQNATDS